MITDLFGKCKGYQLQDDMIHCVNTVMKLCEHFDKIKVLKMLNHAMVRQ